jgi:hypothetical protein
MLSSKKVHITHVKQTHLPAYVPVSEVREKDMEEAAYSQFMVARTILDNPHALVLNEGLYEDYIPSLMKENKNSPVACTLSPEGTFEDYTQLTNEQKKYLAMRTGAVTLFDLGKLPNIYKTIGKQESKQIDALISAGVSEALYEHRERLAIKYAKIAAENSSNQFAKYE